ncbi:uncharacterized protein N7469_001988 [Penicillium citrinum]|uniref:Uncharacterized protein n=1 Tax=Penicillium citrinum TaxID=5077 RepID=A0A9W9TT98_PENCI|nr:uncharacterized protein N7469_001988 [Penicillium citrinum]KAJ5240397.1 hypothetical protein N7469_001988 [Penicillium citrinum]
MSQHSSQNWPKWEEDNLLPWLDAHRELSWEARAEAYYEELGIRRRIDSIRGKKYHILRKRCLARPKASAQRKDQKRQRRLRRLGGPRKGFASLSKAKDDNIDQWLQKIPSEGPISPTSKSPTEETPSVYITPAPEYPPPQGFPSRSVLWDCVHRICATKGLFLHRQ